MARTEDGFSLDVIGVAKPCPADWDAMSPVDGDDRVRHCELCELNVYNLSGMSREAATTLVREREGRLCVRFYRRADGTVLTADCPVGIRRAARWARRKMAGAVVVTLVLLASPLAFAARPTANGGSFADRIAGLPVVRHLVAWLNPAPAPPVPMLMGDVCITPPAPPAPAPQPQPSLFEE